MRGRRRKTLAPGDLSPPPCSSTPGTAAGSRFLCLGSDSEGDAEERLAAWKALVALDDDTGELGWTTVSRRRRRTDAEIRQEFWEDMGFPTPASRFWEKESPELGGRRSSASPSGSSARRRSSSSPMGLAISRGPKIMPWRGPLPARRSSAPPILGMYLEAAVVGASQGPREQFASRSEESVSVCEEVGPIGGPTKAGSDVESTRFTWTGIANRLLGVWRRESSQLYSEPPEPSPSASDRASSSPAPGPLCSPGVSFAAVVCSARMSGQGQGANPRGPASASGLRGAPASAGAVPAAAMRPPGPSSASPAQAAASGLGSMQAPAVANVYQLASGHALFPPGVQFRPPAAYFNALQTIPTQPLQRPYRGASPSFAGQPAASYLPGTVPGPMFHGGYTGDQLGVVPSQPAQSFSVGVGAATLAVPKRKKNKKQPPIRGVQPQMQAPGSYVPPVSQQYTPQEQQIYQPMVVASQVSEGPSVADVGKKNKKFVRCWKCAVNTHATKDCKAVHYCYICDCTAHPTLRCPVLKLPRLTPYMAGIGNDQTLFTQIPDAVVQRHIARRCQVQVQWKWEAVPHGDSAFLVSFPTFENLDRVDGILMTVPLSTAQLTFSVYKMEEVPHKLEMQQVWLHVEGVPHILRSFQGLWAVGGLMGNTLDVDLFSLRKRGIVRILVEMFDTKVFLKEKDSLGHFIVSDAVVKHKVFEFRFRIEPEGYIPEPEFVPFLWRKGDDDADDDANGKHLEDAMDTSEAVIANQGVGSGSSSAVQGTATTSSSQGVQRVFAVTPFNANPVTPRGRQLLDALPLDSPLRGKGSSSAPRVSLAQLQDALHSVSIPVLRSSSASPARRSLADLKIERKS
uniref:Uncharacterized protein n=1 Tax=Avena sativa TaxID=4498 RepID=A0ACD5WF51_AVESA